MGFITAARNGNGLGLGYTYYPSANPFLYANPTGNGIDGSTQQFNSNFYATPAAAAQFAAVLGGQVVEDPTSARFDQNQPMLAVRLADGTTVNAGAIGQVLQNDAAFGNDNVKSGEIAKMFGAQYVPGIAEALRGGTSSVALTAAAPAPGYAPTPLNQSIVDAQKKAAAPTATAAAASIAATIAATSPAAAQMVATVESWPAWALPTAGIALLLLLRR